MNPIRTLLIGLILVVLAALEGGAEQAPREPAAAGAEELAERWGRTADTAGDAAEDWRAGIDAFLDDYLPTVVVRGPEGEGEAMLEYELPEFAVRAEVQEARRVRALPDRWDILGEATKRRLLAEERLTYLETGILNRFILPWGIRPDALLLAREERARVQRTLERNRELLETLEVVRPGVGVER